MFEPMRIGALLLGLFLLPVGCALEAKETADGEDVAVSEDSLSRRAAEFEDVGDADLADREGVLARYESVRHEGVREELFERAVLFFHKNQSRIQNRRWLSIVDFAQHSRERRFHVLDMEGGLPARSFVVAHGSGSDPDHDGRATRFSNTPGSNMTSLGFYETAELYSGEHGRSMRLDGLSATNSNARRRAIVIHEASYVDDGAPRQGRSQGCIVFSPADKPWVLANLRNGTIIYASN